jgi:hypothetical protein
MLRKRATANGQNGCHGKQRGQKVKGNRQFGGFGRSVLEV